MSPEIENIETTTAEQRSASFGSSQERTLVQLTAIDQDLDVTSTRRQVFKQYLALVLTCMLPFGIYYSYDIPGAINVQLQEWFESDFEAWQIRLNGLYSAYSLPNLVMPVVSGVLVDFLGAHRMMMAFAVLIILGQGLVVAGIEFKSFAFLLVGRIVFGIGGESLEVAQARLIVDLFGNKHTGFALGLNLTFARIAGALNDWLSPAIAEQFGVTAASWGGLVACFVGLSCLIPLIYLHKTTKDNSQTEEEECLLEPSPKANGNDDDGYCSEQDQVSSISSDNSKIAHDDEDAFNWRSVFKLSNSFYILCITISLLYGSVNPFIHILSAFLQKTYGYNERKSGMLMSVPDLISAVGSPLFGFLMDKLASSKFLRGKIRSYMLPLSGVLLIISHVCFLLNCFSPLVMLVFIGIAYSLFGSVMWPLVPEVVQNSDLLGTAYGFSSVALNVALTVVPLIVGAIVPVHGYFGALSFFLGLASTGTMLGLFVLLYTARKHLKYSRLPSLDVDEEL